MTHSLNGYREWQAEFKKLISATTFQMPPNVYGLIFQFNICVAKGQPPDLSNLQGGVEDCLVKFGYLKDDNWKILTRFYTFGCWANNPSIILYAVESQKEMLYVVENFCK